MKMSERNMIRVLAFLVAIVGFSSCERNKLQTLNQNNIAKRFYDTGELKEKGAIINGLREGLWIFYDSEGYVVYEAVYHNDEFNGQYISYFENGDTLNIGQYVNGVEEGLWKQFQGEQALLSIGNYDAGKKIGEWKYYNESGNKVMRRILYENGEQKILEDHELSLPK
jgi:antitoxin component YwqK of YwqJK toxin-antitoxin module